MLREMVLKNRSYRRFFEDAAIGRDTLTELVDLARNTASARNLQPLRYILSADRETNARIFPNLFWAMDLKDWPGPAEGERPAAYIVMVIAKGSKMTFISDCDIGIAAQTILLGAVEKGLGGCMIASILKDNLREALKIPEEYEPHLVIALGKPKEKVVIEELLPDGDCKYWRDNEGVHHVPKRRLEDVIL
jgi:nitroreductase